MMMSQSLVRNLKFPNNCTREPVGVLEKEEEGPEDLRVVHLPRAVLKEMEVLETASQNDLNAQVVPPKYRPSKLAQQKLAQGDLALSNPVTSSPVPSNLAQ